MPDNTSSKPKKQSRKELRHLWLIDRLRRTGRVCTSEEDFIEEYCEQFSEARPSQKLVNLFGGNPCGMLQRDCRELYQRGEFGTRQTIGNQYARSYCQATYSVQYVLAECYHCRTPLNGSKYMLGDTQCCRGCYNLHSGIYRDWLTVMENGLTHP